ALPETGGVRVVRVGSPEGASCNSPGRSPGAETGLRPFRAVSESADFPGLRPGLLHDAPSGLKAPPQLSPTFETPPEAGGEGCLAGGSAVWSRCSSDAPAINSMSM